MQSEDSIRDYISQNLQLIDPELRFLNKEYKLPNYVGSKGFVDILATDIFNNYVIVEIKRSKASSRETLQEIVKYVGLIKQNFQARDSEIRVIILSTHWEELFIPFCEFLYQSTLSVKGYKLSMNEIGLVKDAIEIVPEPVTSQRRKLAYTYELAFFYSEEKQQQYINLLSQKSQAIGIQDFVITDLSSEGRSRSPFSYATCYSFNEQTINKYRAMEAVISKIDMEEDEFDSQEHFIDHLEQCVLVALYETGSHDSMDVGSPEALQSMIKDQGWKIEQLYRFGIFKSDPRLTDEMLIKELQGYDGSNPYLYSNFADSSQKDRLSEILANASNPLGWNPQWQENFDNLLECIKNQDKPFRIVVHVYSPKSIFYGIYRFLKYQEIDYLPMYLVFVDYYLDNDSHFYEGTLKWKGKKTDEKSYNNFLKDNSRSMISKKADICAGFFDQDILRYFNLSFKNKLTTINKIQEKKILFFLIDEQKTLIADTGSSHSMVTWVKQNLTFCWSIIQMYEENAYHI
jgi:hypothetical protein